MTLKDTIDRFSHLDIVLGDPAWCADSLPWTTAHDLWVAAKAGQAEIDALTERNAFLLTSAETAQAKLAEARAEVERRDTYIAELAQKLDRLTPYAEAALHTLRAERMFSPGWLIDHREEADKIAAADFETWSALRQRYVTEYPAAEAKG